MVKPPQVCGLILCEQMTFDLAQARMSLDGLFLVLQLAQFPSPPVRFTAYAAFFDGRGEAEMTLTCTHLESEADIYYYKRWLAFAEPGRTIHGEIRIRQLTFPRAGRYAFTLAFNKTVLTVRYLDVLRR